MALAKKSENKTKKLRVLFRAWGPLVTPWCVGWKFIRFPRPNCMQQPFDRRSDAALGRSASLCSGLFSPQVKMPLVRVRIDLERELALDWLCVANAAAGSNFLERFEDCADISRGEKRQFQKKGVDEQLSVHFFFAGEREGTRMEVSPWKPASVVRSFAVALTSQPQDGKAAHVQMPLAHSWQVRPLIHALFRKDSCLKGRRTAASKWLASLQLHDRLAGEEIGIHRRHSSDFGKGVHWKACRRSSSKFWSLHGLREWRWGMSTNLNSFWNLLTAHLNGFNGPELHGRIKLPPLNQTKVKLSSGVTGFMLSFFSHGFKRTDGMRSGGIHKEESDR